MSEGLTTTLKCLAETNNEAAVDLLVQALDSAEPAIQEGAVRALLARKSKAGHRQLLHRWPMMSTQWKEILREHPGRLSTVIRDATLGADRSMCLIGCEAVLELREYDLLAPLINAAEDDANPNADLAITTLVRLCGLLYEDLARSRDGRRGRDPQLLRQHCLGSLEASVQRFFKHQRREILEAFLILANRDNSTLKRILQNPHESSYLAIVELLSTSQRPGIIRLVLSFLDDPHSPSAAVNVVAHRSDEKFLHHLLAKIGYEPSTSARINLKRMNSIAWLRGDLTALDRLNDQQQHAVVQLVMASGMNRLEAFEVVSYLLQRGKVGGRRAAAAALAHFRGAEANQLAIERLEDEDPQVRAHVLSQLRDRSIPGAMNRLLQAIDSPHEVVQTAARKCLSEFNINRFLSAFDMLERVAIL